MDFFKCLNLSMNRVQYSDSISFSGVSYQDEIQPTAKIMHGDKGGFVTLSCNYSGSPYNLQWYRQYPGSPPIFLLLTTVSSNPSVVNATPPYPHLSVELNKERTRLDLEISSANVTDSSLYYCALQPTLIEN
uniref:Ig-like domain-containing protein n=1 Tax=Oncorhynchus tshawytscha TaxID=74940 RepID=A0AAZ3SF51_ONCTS